MKGAALLAEIGTPTGYQDSPTFEGAGVQDFFAGVQCMNTGFEANDTGFNPELGPK